MLTGQQRSGWFRWRECLAALVCCLPAGAGEAPPALAEPDSTLVLNGNIDQAMVDFFNSAIAARDIRTVLVSSAGGQPVHALKIAEGMVAGGMDVVVRTACLGACAQYILVAGRNRHVEDDSLVAFQLSFTGLEAITELLEGDLPEGLQAGLQGLDDMAAAEKRLYQQRGVSGSLLSETMVALQPRCLILRRDSPGAINGLSLSQMTYRMWVPTKKQLASFGLDFAGYWPKSRKQLVRAAERIMDPPEQAQTLRFGNDDHLRRKRGDRYSFSDLKDCVLEEDVAGGPLPEAAN